MGRGKGGKGTVRETPEKGSYGESQPLGTLAFRKETEPLLNSTSTENQLGKRYLRLHSLALQPLAGASCWSDPTRQKTRTLCSSHPSQSPPVQDREHPE